MNIRILWFIVGAIAYILFALRCIKVDNMKFKELFYPKLAVVVAWVLFLFGGFVSLLYVTLVYTFRYIERRQEDGKLKG